MRPLFEYKLMNERFSISKRDLGDGNIIIITFSFNCFAQRRQR